MSYSMHDSCGFSSSTKLHCLILIATIFSVPLVAFEIIVGAKGHCSLPFCWKLKHLVAYNDSHAINLDILRSDTLLMV